MSHVISDMQVLNNALTESRGSADLPEGQAAEEFAERVEAEGDVSIAAVEGDEGVEDAIIPGAEEGDHAAEEEAETEVEDPSTVVDEEAKLPTKKVDETPEAKAAREQAQKEQDELDQDLNPNSVASLKGLFKHLDKDPKFKAAVESNPALKSTLFRMGRMAERADKYDQLFHTPQAANMAKVAADEFFKMDDLFNAEDPAEFTRFLIANSLEYDDKGEPLVDQSTGRFKSTGAYERFANYWQQEWRKDLNAYADRLTKYQHEQARTDGEELIEAMKVLDRVVFGRLTNEKKQVDENDPELANLPANIRQEILESRKARGATRNSQSETLQKFSDEVTAETSTMLKDYAEALINQVLSKNQKIVLSPLSRKHIIAEAIENIQTAEKANTAHSSTFKHMVKSTAQTDEGKKSLIAMKKAYYREILPGYIRRAFSDVTSATIAQAKTRQDVINKGAQRKELQTTGRGISPAARGGSEVNASQVLKDAETKKGKPLGGMEQMDALLGAHYGKK